VDATVVPIDSDAEEVHALGLKKFVEEAKLLWNLSTPTRHPNIVSVRSLFEIHGTAYMVMDFEDGTSLSSLLKKKQRWNEASLSAMIIPIAEGLERAHRVGVLHRDIKPPNILINEDNRPVLIDFGSARFESGDATSTTVTFHTPPYAAIEQYVRTYEQGPWTDIYALGVVLYECVTGSKPPEVLERMHGGLGEPLKAGDWPGYSGKFLSAINAAMEIRPDKRPQSISQWLALFEAPESVTAADPFADADADTTRVSTFAASDDIVPVAPTPPGFTYTDKIETAVPDDPNDVKFKLAGEDTGTSTKDKAAIPNEAEPAAAAAISEPPASKPEPAPKPASKAKPAKPGDPATAKPGLSRPVMIGLSLLALSAVGAGVWYAVDGGTGGAPDPAFAEGASGVAAVDVAAAGGIPAAVKALAEEAQVAKAPAPALALLAAATSRLDGLTSPTDAQMGAIATKAAADFAAALLSDADTRVQRLGGEIRWANPRLRNPAAAETAQRQQIARDVRVALTSLRDAAGAAASATDDPAAALTAARQALVHTGELEAAMARAYRSGDSADATDPRGAAATPEAAASTQGPATAASERAPSGGPSGRPAQMFPAKYRNFNSIVRSARGLIDDVVSLGRRDEPGPDATQQERDAYRIRQDNAQIASGYTRYLDGLEATMRGERTEAEVDFNTANAETTRGYLRDLRAASRATRR
jgi:non-specific serine/threonine protein kinase